MSDIIFRIDWTLEDIATVMEKSGKEATNEEIARFIEKFDWKYFQERMISDGFEMLASGV